MKKILSIFLAAVMLLTSSSIVLAEEKILTREEIPTLSDDSNTAIGLNKLGILKGTGSSFELDRTITRAEAVCLIFRIHPDNPSVLGLPAPVFTDMDNHWAYKEVTAAKKIGLVDGTTETTFTPDRTVTGKEFTKILLSMLGYSELTIENAYEKGIKAEIIANNFTKSVVYNNEPLLRSDAVRLIFSALTAKTADDKMLYNKLIERNKYTYDDFYGILFAGDKAAYTPNFVDKINNQMPEDKNYMFSPLSIKMAFAMAANGADGKTKEQILNALEITDLDEYNQKAKELIEKYAKADILKLDIANALWLNESNTNMDFSNNFSESLKEFYSAEINKSPKDKIAGEINGWVKEKTNGKIEGIITEAFAQRPDFILALLNAVYFKGAWQTEFYEGATKKDVFTDRNGKEAETDFMNKTAYFRYYKDDALEVVSLPFKNSTYDEKTSKRTSYDFDVSMYLIKGDYRDLDLKNICDDQMLSSKRLALSVPKFESEFETSLVEIMKNLGVTEAFDPNFANLTKMFDSFDKGNLYIMDALHKTYIKVDEKGAEAAAVTAIMEGATSAPKDPPIEVKFDSPFTYVIRDNTSGEVLFIGEMAFVE